MAKTRWMRCGRAASSCIAAATAGSWVKILLRMDGSARPWACAAIDAIDAIDAVDAVAAVAAVDGR